MEKVKHRNFYILLFHFKEQRFIRRSTFFCVSIFTIAINVLSVSNQSVA